MTSPPLSSAAWLAAALAARAAAPVLAAKGYAGLAHDLLARADRFDMLAAQSKRPGAGAGHVELVN